MKRLSAAVIGCGTIGGLCDSPDDERIISHAHAYCEHEGFELVAGCDPDPANRDLFRQRWGDRIALFDDPRQLFRQIQPEAVSIAAATTAHAELLQMALEQASVRIIICEKPMVATLAEFETIRRALSDHPDKILLINFQRRFDPGFARLQSTIDANELGAPLYFHGTFSKGLYHNGCHLLELVDRFFGGLQAVQTEDVQWRDDDCYGCFHVRTARCSGQMASIATPNYWQADLDIFCEHGLIRIADSGHRLELLRPQAWPLYPGDSLLKASEVIPDSLAESSLHTVDYAYRLIDNESRARSQVEQQLSFSRKLLELMEQLRSGDAKVTFDCDKEVVLA
jgi:predicted dehydrogenase